MSALWFKSGRLLSPAHGLDQQGDLLVMDGVIHQLGDVSNVPPSAKVIDAEGLWVAPSFVDLSHSLREPGLEHKATIASECAAAAKGGFGALCCPPDMEPVNDSAAVTGFIIDQALSVGKLAVHPIGALTKTLAGEQLSEMHALREAGCIAVTNLRRRFSHLQVALRCLEYASSLNIKVIVCPQDVDLAADGCAHDGALASRLGLAAVPVLAETLAVAQWLILAEETDAQLHFAQISTARAVTMIAEAKAKGIAVTADVALANLCYTERCLQDYDPMYHVQPPLRSEDDRLGLLKGVNDGTLDGICSHHQPHERAAKQAPFAETSAGMCQAELVWPQVLELVNRGELQLSQAITALTSGPAEALGLSPPGLMAGEPANITVLDARKKWVVNEQDLWSAGKNSPVIGAEVTGKPVFTCYRGVPVYRE